MECSNNHRRYRDHAHDSLGAVGLPQRVNHVRSRPVLQPRCLIAKLTTQLISARDSYRDKTSSPRRTPTSPSTWWLPAPPAAHTARSPRHRENRPTAASPLNCQPAKQRKPSFLFGHSMNLSCPGSWFVSAASLCNLLWLCATALTSEGGPHRFALAARIPMPFCHAL